MACIVIFIISIKFLLIFYFISKCDSSCLNYKDKFQWERKFFFKNKEIPLIIEVSPRPSHHIVSHILAILLKERLGYNQVEFNYQNWDGTNEVIRRLGCQFNQCQDDKPASHINLEVWKSPGYTFNDKDKEYLVDCGPLGPKAKKGIFIKSTNEPHLRTKNKVMDHWRLFEIDNKLCKNSSRQNCISIFKSDIKEIDKEFDDLSKSLSPNILINYYSKADPKAHISALSNSLYSENNLFLNWYPNVWTVQGSYTPLLLPDCWNSVVDISCDFEVNQLTKMVWRNIKNQADKAYELIRDFMLTQEEYESLLTKVVEETDVEYDRLACDWVKNHTTKWYSWTTRWNKTDEIYLPVLISDYGTWKATDTFNASMRGIMNLNKHYFNNTHFQIVPLIHDLPCNEDAILNVYLDIIERYDPKILGFIVCLCPQSFNTVLKVSDIQNRIIVSASIESTHNKNVSHYKHFFSTSPNMIHYNLVLIQMFQKFNWKRVVILKKDDHLIDTNMLTRYDIKVLAVLSKKEDEIDYNETYEFLETSKRTHTASIFIVDYYIHGTQLVMCAAGNLGMTLDNGYVFILNPFINPHWFTNSTAIPCLTENAILSKEYFIIKHDTTSEHRDNYIRNNVLKYDYLAQLTHDAILYVGKSFYQLLIDIPSAYSSWGTQNISKKYIDLLANQTQSMIGKKERYGRKVFNENHDRNGIWQIQQVAAFGRHHLIAVSIFNWDIKFGFDLGTGLPKLVNVSMVALYTGQSNKPLLDVNRESNCPVERFRELLNWSCHATMLFINLVAVAVLVISLISALVFYYFRQSVKAEDRYKKPFEDLCAELAEIDIRSTDVIINLQVGKGAFGIVYGGEAKRKNHWESVAIKLIKKEADYQGKIDFLTEAKLMRNLEHSNIVKLIGICLNPPKPVIYLVMELVVNGDLEDHLLSHRITAQQDPMNKLVCPALLTRFVKDIASGADYLHQNNLLHRDLACRNCFLSEDYVIKIGDFGLTRHINDSHVNQYYRVSRHFVLPARWMPPEAVQFGYFSIQSDIWSLGVIIFEIATFCSRPYFNVSDEEVPELVKRNTMPLVNYLPEISKGSHTYKLIEKCCQYKREERPESMKNIIVYLEENSECIRPYLTIDPPQHHMINIGNCGQNWINPIEGSQRAGSLASGGLSRFKSYSRSRTSAGNWGMYSESQTNFESFFRNEFEGGFKENIEQIPFIPSEDEFITLNRNSNRTGSKKRHRSGNRKSTSNLNSSKSRSSDFMIKRIDDDQEPSYVSCPDQENNHQILGNFDPQDFPLNDDITTQILRSASGDEKSISSGKRIKSYRNGKIIYSGSSRNRKVKININTLSNKSKLKLGSSQGMVVRKISEPNGLRHEVFQPLLYDRPANVSIQPRKLKSFKSFGDDDIC